MTLDGIVRELGGWILRTIYFASSVSSDLKGRMKAMTREAAGTLVGAL